MAATASLPLGFSPAVAQSSAASASLPHLGEPGDLGLGAERRLGERIAAQLYRDPDYIDDPELALYVDTLWQPLLRAARTRGELPPEMAERFALSVLLGRDRSINAFALPGGYFGLHLGLIAATQDRSELASVLAHELSHVTQRHIARLLDQQNRQAPWVLAGMVLGALAAAKSPDAANALLVGSQALAAQAQLNFSRDMEREADRVGFSLMDEAGFAASGFANMFERLQQANRLNDNGAFAYLRSHPLTGERLADMRARLGVPGAIPKPEADVWAALMAARARTLTGPGQDALRQAAQAEPPGGGATLADAKRRAAHWYASALAYARLRDAATARQRWQQLQSTLQAMPAAAVDAQAWRALHALGAELAVLAADGPLAQAELQRVAQWETRLGFKSPSRATLMGRVSAAQAAFVGGAPMAAATVSELAQAMADYTAAHPLDGPAWAALAQLRQLQGLALAALRAQAESRAAWYDYAGAVEHGRAAQRLATQRNAAGQVPQLSAAETIELAILDTRTRAWSLVLAEQALERRVNQ